jgi:hypothetical protein
MSGVVPMSRTGVMYRERYGYANSLLNIPAKFAALSRGTVLRSQSVPAPTRVPVARMKLSRPCHLQAYPRAAAK